MPRVLVVAADQQRDPITPTVTCPVPKGPAGQAARWHRRRARDDRALYQQRVRWSRAETQRWQVEVQQRIDAMQQRRVGLAQLGVVARPEHMTIEPLRCGAWRAPRADRLDEPCVRCGRPSREHEPHPALGRYPHGMI